MVKDVPKTARLAYADVWMPYQSLPQVDSFFNMYEGLVGPLSVVMMMKDAGDYEAVRAEMLRAADRMNASLERYNISFFQAPYRSIDLMMTDYDTWVDKIDAPGWMLKRGGLVLLLLLPALNPGDKGYVGTEERGQAYWNRICALFGASDADRRCRSCRMCFLQHTLQQW